MISRVILLIVVLLASGALMADEMPYSFTTTGTLGGTPTDLSFLGDSVAVTGQTVGGAASPLALGSFTVSRPGPGQTIDDSAGIPFTLNIFFLAPPSIVGGNDGLFDAVVKGTITRGAGNGKLDVVFTPNFDPFTFDDGVIEGAFTFGVNNLTGIDWGSGNNNSKSWELTGYISGATQSDAGATVPEPGSIVLLATVLGGVLLSVRRKYSA